jgi:acetyl-CoA C-acetyltransferase
MAASPGHRVVLAGVGACSQREDDPLRAREPLALMIDAVRQACTDAGLGPQVPPVDAIAVPRGRWRYRDPGRAIAAALGLGTPATLLAGLGVLQQSLIGELIGRIARGEIESAIVVGGDAGHRLQRARRAGVRLQDSQQDTDPDAVLAPPEPLLHPVELRAGIRMPAPLYAILESAWRHRHGWRVDEHRQRLAALLAEFGAVAAANPDAWRRRPIDMHELIDGSERNAWQAVPYTRLHCSSWNVDQAAALLLVSERHADRLGVPPGRRLHPWSSTESNRMIPVSARADLTGFEDAGLAAAAALDHPGLGIDQVELLDLYSCFPVAVQAHARALGVPQGRNLTVTGGMPLAGGPFNNYVLQATARMAGLMRSGAGRLGLVSCVSGILTKHAFGLWGVGPPPGDVQRCDLTDTAAACLRMLEVIDPRDGPGAIVGCTVVHEPGAAPRALALIGYDDERRTLAWSDDPTIVDTIARRECVGATVRLAAGQFRF